MASIGNLVVNLSANTAAFNKGMAGARQTVERMGAAVLAMGAASVAVLTQQGDEFDKMSKRTGIATEDLSRFAFASQQSGTDIKALELGLRRMAKLMLDSDRGMATATETMKALGITASQMAGKGQIERFTMFGEAIKNIEDPATRTALAMEVFGRSGTQMLPLINEGADGMRRLANEADALGATVTKTQSIFGADLTDAFNRVKVSGLGLMRVIGTHMATPIVKMANAIAAAVSGMRDFAPALTFAGTAVAVLAVALKGATLATWLFSKASIVALSLTGPKGWLILGGAVLAATAATVALTQSMEASTEAMQKANAETGATPMVATEAADRVNELAEAMDASEAKAAKFADAMKGLRTPVQRVKDAVAEFKQMLSDTKTTIVWDRHPLVEAMRQKESGFTSMLKSVGSELAILRGDATATGLKIKEMLAAGVNPKQIDTLRGKLKEIAQLKSDKEGAQFQADHMDKLKSQADSIKKALATPGELIAAQAKQLQTLVGSGMLSPKQSEAFMKKFKEGLSGTEAAPQQSETKFASAMQKGSADAFTAIVKAMSGATPETKELQKQTKEIKSLPKHIARAIAYKKLHMQEQPAV